MRSVEGVCNNLSTCGVLRAFATTCQHAGCWGRLQQPVNIRGVEKDLQQHSNIRLATTNRNILNYKKKRCQLRVEQMRIRTDNSNEGCLSERHKYFKWRRLKDVIWEMLQVTLIARHSQRNVSSWDERKKCRAWALILESQSKTINLVAPWTSDHYVPVLVCALRVLLGQIVCQLQTKSLR